MTKQEQTQQVLIELCDLTVKLTERYQPQYYYQYRGDPHDLAMEFYCEFLTPKARGNNPKESLLDKYDPSVTSLAYLTKVAVIRKLIDKSRADNYQTVSIDTLVSEYGDLINKVFDLTVTAIDEDLCDEPYFRRRLLTSYMELDEFSRNSIFAKLYDSSSPLCSFLPVTIRYIHNCPIQQVTDKTAVLFVPGADMCIDFSLIDGHPKGKVKPFTIDIKGVEKYHSGFSRLLFEDFILNGKSNIESFSSVRI